MRTAIIAIIIALSPLTILHGQTQVEMNQEAENQYINTSKKLNSVCQVILRKYANNKIFIKNAKIAQRKWIQFRDSQVAMKFPQRASPGYYGSVLPMCYFNYLTEITEDRIKQFTQYTIPWIEWGVSSGITCPSGEQTEANYMAKDKALNSVYQLILRKYTKDKIFIKALKDAQRKWIQFRDAQIAMNLSTRPSMGHDGRVLPMSKFYYLANLTEDRTKQLTQWTIPWVEGDVCGGTVGVFEEYVM